MKLCLSTVFRLKPDQSVADETSLNRCLGIFDLVVIGIGAVIGSGIYVMTGITAKEQAGPGIILSFLLASLIIILIAACFTELSARLHKSGSTYLYLYMTAGEFPAFVLGVNRLFSNLLAGAADARAFSSYADFLFNGTLSTFSEQHLAHWHYPSPIGSYPDLVAVSVVIFLTIVVALGVKISARFTAVFVIVNILVLSFTTVCGLLFGNFDNWTSADNGGFLTFGWRGVIAGSATCFWSFSGFEVMSSVVEECRRPKRDVPVATLLTMVVATGLYVGTAAGLTLMVPSRLIDIGAPLPSAFAHAGLHWQGYVVVFGPLCGLTTNFIVNTLCFARTSFAMAEDGLLFEYFERVSSCTKVPVLSVVICGILQAAIACFCDTRDLITFNINTVLISDASACVAVIMLRYSGQSDHAHKPHNTGEIEDSQPDKMESAEKETRSPFITGQSTGFRSRIPCKCIALLLARRNRNRRVCLTISMVIMILLMVELAVLLLYGLALLESGTWWLYLVVALIVTAISILLCVIASYRQLLLDAVFKVPCVPVIPSLGLFACVVLLVSNSTLIGWIICLALLLLAGAVYAVYGVHHSRLNAMFGHVTVVQPITDNTAVPLLDSEHNNCDYDDLY